MFIVWLVVVGFVYIFKHVKRYLFMLFIVRFYYFLYVVCMAVGGRGVC